jgi:nucleoside-diphosphate kinase
METTLVLIKPDATERNLIGSVLKYFENNDLKITRMRSFLNPPVCLCGLHYKEHKGKTFYRRNVEFLHSGLVIAVLVSGENAISRVRELVGATDPAKADSGTIRHDLGWVDHHWSPLPRNLIHASDSYDAVDWEMGLWFQD